jgi:hypothetical protein
MFIFHVHRKLKKKQILQDLGSGIFSYFTKQQLENRDERNQINAGWKEFIMKDSTWNNWNMELKKWQTTIIREHQ